MERLILIDAYSQIFRCYYAMKATLTNPKGEPTNALYGIARLLLQIERTQPCRYGAICFDKGKSVRRTELLPEYKAQRAPMPEDLRVQIDRIKDWMSAFGWTLFEEEGIEADDLIAGVTREAVGYDVGIITHDKDLAQLLAQEHVTLLLSAAGGTWAETHASDVEAKYGLAPSMLGDYLALVGDAVDNIKGVEGVGPKTASKLLVEHGGLEGLMSNLETLKAGRVRDNLSAGVELLARNRKLVELYSDLPSGWSGVSGIRRREPDWGRLITMAQDEGFTSLGKPLEEARRASAQPMLF